MEVKGKKNKQEKHLSKMKNLPLINEKHTVAYFETPQNHITIYRLKQAKDLRETLVEKLKIATESTLSAEERALKMDELLEEEEKRQKDIDYQLKYLRDLQFRKMQELHDNKIQERNTEAEIQV